MLPLATICNIPRWRTVAGNKSAQSFQEENDFFRDVLSVFKSLPSSWGPCCLKKKYTDMAMHTKTVREIQEKLAENDRCTGAKMICCKMRSWIFCKLSALPVSLFFGKSFQPVTPSNHKIRNIWVAITLYFLDQGINYCIAENQFGVAVPTVCRIGQEEAKTIVDNLTSECANFRRPCDFLRQAFSQFHALESLTGATLWYPTPYRMRGWFLRSKSILLQFSPRNLWWRWEIFEC